MSAMASVLNKSSPGWRRFSAIRRRKYSRMKSCAASAAAICSSVGRCPGTCHRATLTHMQKIGVRQLQQNAGAALRRVRRGERLEVTDRGRPVAVLSPAVHASVIDALEAAGRVTRGEGNLLDLPAPIRLTAGAERPSRRLARLRAHER